MITTPAPRRPPGESAIGSPRRLGMSSAIREKVLRFTRVEFATVFQSR